MTFIEIFLSKFSKNDLYENFCFVLVADEGVDAGIHGLPFCHLSSLHERCCHHCLVSKDL